VAELRQLRYFLAVAERLSFSRAALDLHISQPACSESVRKLERELGVTLLIRSSRRLTLTPAGEMLLQEGRKAVAQVDLALARTQQAHRGEAGHLRVGFEAAGAGSLTTRARARFARRFPDVSVTPRRFDWGGEVDALRDGRCDVAFVWLPADSTGLVMEVIAVEARFAGLANEHPLATRAALSVNELNHEPLMWTRRAPRFWVDWWAVNPRPDGAEPTWGPENDNVEEMLERVAEGVAYCIVPQSMTEFYSRPDIAWIPIEDVEPLRIALAWRSNERSPLVAAFVSVAREVAAERAVPA
jgi:DNA-binding transcriptional LysR family regulator